MITRQNGSTDSIKRPYQRINAASIITKWDVDAEDYGKLFFVHDVRMNTLDDSSTSVGIVAEEYVNEDKDGILTRYKHYPTSCIPFHKHAIHIFPHFYQWIPCLLPVHAMPGTMSNDPVEFSTEALIGTIGKATPPIKPYPSAFHAIEAMRAYFTYYLHVDTQARTRLALMPNPADFKNLLKPISSADRKLLKSPSMYATPESMVSRDRIGIWFCEELIQVIHINEQWKESITEFIEQWKQAKHIQRSK